MPVYTFKCSRGHETDIVVRVSDMPGPGKVKCKAHKGMTHYEGCDRVHRCDQWARRVTVYRVGVGGDLPTRGAF
jgi:hypothetical protein